MLKVYKPNRGTLVNKSHPLVRGMKCCFLFNESTGDKIFDLSGNENHGTISGYSNTSMSWDQTEKGSSIYGTDTNTDYITVPHIDISSGGTVLTLVKNNNIAADRCIVGCDDGGANIEWQLWMDNASPDRYGFTIYDGGYVSIYDSTVPTVAGTTYQVGFTYNAAGSGRLFVNGVNNISDNSATISNSGLDWRIFQLQNGTKQAIDAHIIYFYVWDRTLSDAEVLSIYKEPYQIFGMDIQPAAAAAAVVVSSIIFRQSINYTAGKRILYSSTVAPPAVINGLQFPSTVDAPTARFIAFQFKNPQLDGMPFYGGDGETSGSTWVWEFKPTQQAGYYVTFWYSDLDFLWDGGGSNTYYGCHPYPVGGGQNTVHNWEIAGLNGGADNQTTLGGSPLVVVKEQWYKQAFRLVVNGDGTKTGKFYIDIPPTGGIDDFVSSSIIEYTVTDTFGDTVSPNTYITFGDSPWFPDFQHERMSGVLGRVKIFNASMTEGEILSESRDFTALQTTKGTNNIWWGKTSFDNVFDLTCDYGTNRSASWSIAYDGGSGDSTSDTASLIDITSDLP